VATLRLYVCDEPGTAGEEAISFTSNERGICTASNGHWQQVDTSTLQFDLVSWLNVPENQAEFAAFFGAGFILVGMSYAIGWGVRSLLSLIGR